MRSLNLPAAAGALSSQRPTVFQQMFFILAMADRLMPSTLMAATSSKSRRVQCSW
jgi:hypothetical protein